MKSRFLNIILITIILLSFGCKNDNKGKESQDTKSELESADYFFPPEVFYFQNRSDYLVDKFFPIGWSEDGNFAYITEPVAEGLGNYVFEIVIMNVISGDTLWYWHSPYDQNLVREEVWKDNYDLFKTMLNQYHIVQMKEPQLLSPYFNYQGDDYTVELRTDFRKLPGYGFEGVGHTRVILRSPQKGVKIVYDKQLSRKSIIINQTVAGVILSPLNDKIAIILQQERPGYEGPPNVVTFQIIGTNLSTGWNYQM